MSRLPFFFSGMNVARISITGFRNLDRLKAGFAAGVNIFYGDNGSGKTNLLEAIFTLCLARSQRGANDTVMLNSEADVYRLVGVIDLSGKSLEVAVAFQKGGRKKITIDGVPSKASELYQRLSAVSSGPEDSEILSGPPSARRTFLDMHLSQLSGRYLSDLVDYQKVLAQKNAALKNEMDASAFDLLLIDYGSRLIQARQEFLDELIPLVAERYGAISSGEKLKARYDPDISLETASGEASSIRSAFEDALMRAADRERLRQTALVGPHRDDVNFTVGGLPARSHGSQGQWRTAAVCLKLAVFELLKQKRRVAPLLLLDEIFAELDSSRAHGLMETLTEAGQIFLTTAVEPPESISREARKFRIAGGRIMDVD